MTPTQSTVMSLLLGGATGAGVTGLFIILFKLLFAREKSEYARLDARIIILETALGTEQAGHMDCIKELGIVKGQLMQLSTDLDFAIRRHDHKNQDNLKALENYVKELETQLTKNGLPVPPMATASLS